MVSSVRAQMIAAIQQEKMERNAAEERIKSEDDQQQHQQAEVGGVSAGAVSSDSSVEGGEVKVRSRGLKGEFIRDDPATPENEAWTIKPAKDNGRRDRKKVQ